MESLTYRGTTNGAYSVTSGSTTSIYVKKSEAYDQLGVLEFLKDSYDAFTVTWKNEFVSSLPSGYKTATQVFSPGTANTAQVLTGYTFSSANGTNLSGTMANRGNLNWSGSNTTYSVPAGYYSGGTLDSRPSYNNGYNAGNSAGYNSGYNAGVNAGKSSMTWQVINKDSTTANSNVSTSISIPSGYRKFYGCCSLGIPSTRHSMSISNATLQHEWVAVDNYSRGTIFYGTLNGSARTITITTWTTSTKVMKIRGIICYA